MSHLKIFIELDYEDAVAVARLVESFTRAKTRHQKCRLCGADLLTGGSHEPKCQINILASILGQMDPPVRPSPWKLLWQFLTRESVC